MWMGESNRPTSESANGSEGGVFLQRKISFAERDTVYFLHHHLVPLEKGYVPIFYTAT
jgi:hypothetical protein